MTAVETHFATDQTGLATVFVFFLIGVFYYAENISDPFGAIIKLRKHTTLWLFGSSFVLMFAFESLLVNLVSPEYGFQLLADFCFMILIYSVVTIFTLVAGKNLDRAPVIEKIPNRVLLGIGFLVFFLSGFGLFAVFTGLIGSST